MALIGWRGVARGISEPGTRGIVEVCLFVCLLDGCVTSQQHVSVSQGRG